MVPQMMVFQIFERCTHGFEILHPILCPSIFIPFKKLPTACMILWFCRACSLFHFLLRLAFRLDLNFLVPNFLRVFAHKNCVCNVWRCYFVEAMFCYDSSYIFIDVVPPNCMFDVIINKGQEWFSFFMRWFKALFCCPTSDIHVNFWWWIKMTLSRFNVTWD